MTNKPSPGTGTVGRPAPLSPAAKRLRSTVSVLNSIYRWLEIRQTCEPDRPLAQTEIDRLEVGRSCIDSELARLEREQERYELAEARDGR